MDDRDGRDEPDGRRRDRADAEPRDAPDPSDPPGVHPRTQDALLDHYAEMRADARAGDRARNRLFRNGLVAVAVLLALAYVEPGRPWIVAAVPVVLTLLFVAAVAAENRTTRRIRQVAGVERLLDVPGVDYEREHGPLSARAGRLRHQLLSYALAGCFVVLWLGSMAAGLVEFYEDPPTVADWAVSAAVPAVVYLVLVAMVTVSAWTYLATRGEHRLAAQRARWEDGTYAQRRLDEFVDDDELVDDTDETAEEVDAQSETDDVDETADVEVDEIAETDGTPESVGGADPTE